MSVSDQLPRYDRARSYQWNYQNAPEPIDGPVVRMPGQWQFCGQPVDSPLGIAAGPLLNGKWCLYYASLGFDVLTYKTVRSCERACYELPNLQPVHTGQLAGGEVEVPASDQMAGSWAVSFGMPSMAPGVWRRDVEQTRSQLAKGKLLSVSTVATVQEGWTLTDLADDYATCARWAVQSGADAVETNFSCPNVATCDGQLYQNPADSKRVAERVREAIGDTPYILKIGHFLSLESAEAFLDAVGQVVDALAMTNSIATRVRGGGKELMFTGQHRGICGDAIRDASTSQVRCFQRWILEREWPLQLIGVGGISTAQQVQNYLDAGAHACHLATSPMVNPGIGFEIKNELNSR